ncbi:erythromycin esterase family protein [Gracilibacillus suaedae]|uniref:erythromycin esterase family protein n=1 Tax=Gracilibacillus suaedae TaxID=2820273 RepID=UPI001ABE5E53|nr:erythromycin esterase family protein [Gracilibacillus suaedae]
MKLCKYILFFFVLIPLSACSNGEPLENASQYVESVNDINIPNDVQIIGLGEATHGNIEFQEMKRDVFETLIQNNNVRVFVLEADFGGGQQINQFILHSIGTAQEAVYALDYDIYKTNQMIDLVQWMHDYNASVSNDEKIYFYGNDMQRYDYSKKGLLDYYEVVDSDLAKEYSSLLEDATNDRMLELTAQELTEINNHMDQIIADLQEKQSEYVQLSSDEEYAFTLQYAQVIKQRTALFLNEDQYADLRDQYLAENLEWIVKFEQARGHDKVLVSGHNGHIEKTSASPAGYESMGSYLDEKYGSQYYAIGTDFITSEFQSKKGNSKERDVYKITNHNELVDAFSDINQNMFYVDFEEASQSEALQSILSNEQQMANIGDQFSFWYKFASRFYTIKMTPIEAYDGIIIVKEAVPTEVKE